MLDIILNYIVQALLGGAAGYITNDYAINMLFREYTPLHIGGVIKKTRREFTENLSNLVETDIIDKDRLSSILSKDSFASNFDMLSENFFAKGLHDSCGTDTFGDISGFKTTVQNTSEIISAMLSSSLDDLILSAAGSIDTHSVFTDELIYSVSAKIISLLAQWFESPENTSNILMPLYRSIADVPFKDIADISSIQGHIASALAEQAALESDTTCRQDVADFIALLLSDSGTGAAKALSKSADLLSERKLCSILHIDEEITDSLSSKIIAYFNSDTGQTAVSDICCKLVTYLSSSDKTLFDIVDDELEPALMRFIDDKLPKAAAKLTAWILQNKSDIDRLIQESVDEVISESSGMRSKMLNMVKGSLLSNIGERYNIVGKIIDYIKRESESPDMPQKLCSMLKTSLETVSLGDIFTYLTEKNIITAEKMTAYLTVCIDRHTADLIKEACRHILDQKAGIFLHSDFAKSILPRITSLPDMRRPLSMFISSKLKKLSDESLSSLLSESDLKALIPSLSASLSASVRQSDVTDKLSSVIESHLPDTKQLTQVLIKDDTLHTISNWVMSYYKNISQSLSEMKISKALDSLNRLPGLYSSSSTVLRRLITDNIGTILQGSVRSIVESNLNKLSDDELCHLANDFIGRELKPIMYFGGLLGTSAGILLAACNTGAVDLSLLTLPNMAAYAAVGVLTNLIAINMLFKPYKKIALLDRIPLLRNFSQGYIVRNKPVFAESMAKLINDHLLSPRSINVLLDAYQDSIKMSFIKTVGSDNYRLLQNLTVRNEKLIVQKGAAFTLNAINDSSQAISKFAYKKIKDLTVGSIVSEKMLHSAESRILAALRQKSRFAGQSACALLRSDKPVDLMLPAPIMSKLESSIYSSVSAYCHNFIEKSGDLSAVSAFLLNYEEAYSTLLSRTIGDEAAHKAAEMLKKTASQVIDSDRLSASAISLVSKALDSDKPIKDIFGGRVQTLINDRMPAAFNRISEIIKNNIVSLRVPIYDTIKKEINSNLGFIEKSMYSFMNGDALIDDIVSRLLLFKLPEFIDSRRDELLPVFSGLTEKYVFNLKLGSLRLFADKNRISTMVSDFLSNSGNTEHMKNILASALDKAADKLSDIRLEKLADMAGLKSISSILSNYPDEIGAFLNAASESLHQNESKLTEETLALAGKLSAAITHDMSLSSIFSKVSDEAIIRTVESLFSTLLIDYRGDMLIKPVSKFACTIPLHQLAGEDEVTKAMTSSLKLIVQNSDVSSQAKKIWAQALSMAYESGFAFIDDSTKKYLMEKTADAGIFSLRENLSEILKSIRFDEIAREQIESMDGKKIHDMFNSFAGKYFRRITAYGVGGFAFGINIYAGLAITLTKIINELLKHE